MKNPFFESDADKPDPPANPFFAEPPKVEQKPDPPKTLHLPKKPK